MRNEKQSSINKKWEEMRNEKKRETCKFEMLDMGNVRNKNPEKWETWEISNKRRKKWDTWEMENKKSGRWENRNARNGKGEMRNIENCGNNENKWKMINVK